MGGGGAEIGASHIKVSPKIAGNFKAIVEKAMPSGSKIGGEFSAGMKSAVSAGAVAVGNILSDVVKSGAAAAKDIAGEVLSSFGDFEQLEGGIKLALGDKVWEQVEKRGADAFKNLQMSQNDYLEQVNFMATGLREALGGDQQAAADLADRVITTQADVVAAMGASAESVQNAFQGVMKGNFTMLDNLQLGIKPTKEGMQEVIDKMNEWNAAQSDREATQYAIDNLADCQSALADYVEYLGLSGYAAAEGADTVQGSIATMQASWGNFVSSLMKGDADVGKLADDLMGSVSNVVGKVVPLAMTAAGSLAAALPSMAADLAPLVMEQVDAIVLPAASYLSAHGPEVAAAAGEMFAGVAQGAAMALPGAVGMLGSGVSTLISMVPAALPGMVSGAVSLFMGLLVGLVQTSPSIASALGSLVVQLPSIVMNAAGQMLGAAVVFFLSIGEAFGEFVNDLGPKFEYFITHLPEVVMGAIGGMADAAGQLWGSFVDGLIGACENGTSIVEGSAEQTAQAAADAALSASDASGAGRLITDTMSQGMDYESVKAAAAEAASRGAEAAAQAADGTQVAEALAQTTAAGVDQSALVMPATDMVNNAVEAAKNVDVSSIGKEFSAKAAAGVDVNAMSAKAAELAKGAAGNLNTTSTVSVKADLSGVNSLKSASASVTASYKGLQASISAAMSAAAAAASRAGASIKRSIDIPNKTIKVNVAKGSVQLPHFYMTGDFNPKTKSVPHVSVSWFAKGAIFAPNSPGIVGLGDAPVPEVAAPIDKLADMLGLDDRRSGGVTVNLNYTRDDGAVQMARDLGRLLGRRSMMEA